MRQVIRVLEIYFNQLDSNAPSHAQSYTADNFYGGAFNGYIQNTTTTERVALAAVAGQLVFDTTLHKLCVYSGTAWETITSTVTPIKVYVTTVSATGSVGTVTPKAKANVSPTGVSATGSLGTVTVTV